MELLHSFPNAGRIFEKAFVQTPRGQQRRRSSQGSSKTFLPRRTLHLNRQFKNPICHLDTLTDVRRECSSRFQEILLTPAQFLFRPPIQIILSRELISHLLTRLPTRARFLFRRLIQIIPSRELTSRLRNRSRMKRINKRSNAFIKTQRGF